MRRFVLAAFLVGALLATVGATPTAAAGNSKAPPTITRIQGHTGYYQTRGDPDSRGFGAQAWLAGLDRAAEGRVRFTVAYDTPTGAVQDPATPRDEPVFAAQGTYLTVVWRPPSEVPADATAVTVTAQILRLVPRSKAYAPVGSVYTASGALPAPFVPGYDVFDIAS